MFATTSTPGTSRPTPADVRPVAGLRAGALTGAAGAVIAVPTALALQAATGTHFAELGPASVAVASLVASTVGGVIYSWLTRHSRRPGRAFGWLAVAVATADSALSLVAAPAPGFATVAVPLHYVVAGVAAALLPRLVRRSH